MEASASLRARRASPWSARRLARSSWPRRAICRSSVTAYARWASMRRASFSGVVTPSQGRPRDVGDERHRSDSGVDQPSLGRGDHRNAWDVEEQHNERGNEHAEEQVVHLEQGVGSRDTHAGRGRPVA